jgi:hypothetical protein
MAIEASVRAAIRAEEPGRFELYLDEYFYNSLRFRFEFDKRARPKYAYPSPMMDAGDLPPFVTPRPAKLTPVQPGSGCDGCE